MTLSERIRTERALVVLPGLSGTLQPRVRAAVLRTWWNGWVTKRRMQDRSKGCIFGCTSEDSIEHYACCSTVREFGQRSLGLDSPTPETAMEDFLALTPTLSSVTKELVARKAVRLASVYLVHCKARHNRQRAGPLTGAALGHMMAELTRQTLS